MTRMMTLATCLGATCALCLTAIPAARANLLTNGGFETEASTPAIPPPGWTASGNGMAVDTSFPQSGSYDVAFTALSMVPALLFFMAAEKRIVGGLSGAVKG